MCPEQTCFILSQCLLTPDEAQKEPLMVSIACFKPKHGPPSGAPGAISRALSPFECILYSTHSVIRLEQHAGHCFALTASTLADTLSYLRQFTLS